jgi:hypothetical protein
VSCIRQDVDRRYSQARGAGGVRASDSGAKRREAYARARIARGRVNARAARTGGNERGPKSIDPYAAVNILRGRAALRAERDRVFREEGSGAYGSGPALAAARRQDEEQQDLLPGL